MRISRIAVAGLVCAALSGMPLVAGAAEPWIPRNTVPAGEYLVITPPQGPIPTTFSGTPLENCRMFVAGDGIGVELACGAHRFPGRQTPNGPNETYLTFGAVPLGLAFTPQVTPGYWQGRVTVAGTPVVVYPAGLWLRPLPL